MIRKLIISIATLLLFFGFIACTESDSESHDSSLQPKSNMIFVKPDAGKTWNIFGLQIVGKIMSSETGGSYSVIQSTTPPNGGPPPHVHQNEDELFYVIKGTYEFSCGDKKQRAQKGSLIHLPKGIPHSFKNTGDTEGILLNTISPGGFENFFEEIDQLPKDKPLDRKKVSEIAGKYGLKFLK